MTCTYTYTCDTCGCTSCDCDQLASCSCPPSPAPPWSRETQSPLSQTLTAAGSINLSVATTYLDHALNTPAAPITVVIPDGNYKGQPKTIAIRADKLGTTETFLVSGTFAGCTGLTLDGNGSLSLLMWDGAAWNVVGGNAVKNGPVPVTPNEDYVAV